MVAPSPIRFGREGRVGRAGRDGAERTASITNAGATWGKVELIAQSSSSVTDTDNDGD